MGRAGGGGEGGGHHQHRGALQGHDPVELGEAEVVADGQAEHRTGPSGAAGPAPSGATHSRSPGAIGGRLAEGGAASVHVEEVDLAVDGLDRPGGTEQAAGVGQPPVGVPPPLAAARGSCRPPGGSRAAGPAPRPRSPWGRPGARRGPAGSRGRRPPRSTRGGPPGRPRRRPPPPPGLGGVEVRPPIRAGRRLDGCHAHGTG